MIHSELWRNYKYSQPHTSHAMSQTHTLFTHFFLHDCAGLKYLIYLFLLSPASRADSCGDGHTRPSPCNTQAHMRILAHTSALQTAHSHFSFAQDVTKSSLLLKLSEGRWESSLTHIYTHTHSHSSPGTCTHSPAEKLSPSPLPLWARSLPVVGLSPGAKRPILRWFDFTAQSLSQKLWLVSQGSRVERRRRGGVVMAVTDIAEDDLDEMMREEAEDVFSEDGRLCQGSVGRCESRRGFTGVLNWLHEHCREIRFCGFTLVVVIGG